MLIEAEIWPFQVAHQGYLDLMTDHPSLGRLGDRNFEHCASPCELPFTYVKEEAIRDRSLFMAGEASKNI